MFVESDILFFFDRMPRALPLCQALMEKLSACLPEYSVKVQKTQISFANRYQFAFVSLPMRKIKDRPEVYIIITFGLEHQLQHPRIAQSTEPYPNRWTHHVVVQSVDEIDAELLGWIAQAYDFSLHK